MTGAKKSMALTFAERCKNILSGNWQGYLHTVKADAKGSKQDIHRSKVQYLFKKGRPYLWIQGGDLHNVNTVIDERGSLSVTTCLPGSLMSLMRTINKLPPRVALTGDVVPLRDEKVPLAAAALKESLLSEQKTLHRASYSVSGILSSSSILCNTRSENLEKAFDASETYAVHKFNIRSCTYIDGYGKSHEVDLDDIEASRTDLLSPFAEKLIDGINLSQARRRALMLFCFVYLNTTAQDAFMLSVDRKGFDVLGKVPGMITRDGLGQYEWKELRFTFEEEVGDIEAFCRQLVAMEEAAIKEISTCSGLG